MSKHRIYSGIVTSGLVAAENGVAKIASMTWKDHLTMLLHIAAEIEHSLMVQYLYAAYSLGGEQVPPDSRQMVRGWQEDILAVASEEMGHLLTVQNILMLIGAPINLDRQDLPWDIPFHPGTFRLERLTLDSVASYVFAEMPSGDELDALIQTTKPGDELLGRYKRFKQTDLEQIEIMVRNRDSSPHRVGDLYSQITTLVANPHHIPDSVFQEWTLTHQASADDWGRGYRPDPRLVTADGSLAAEPSKPVGSARSQRSHLSGCDTQPGAEGIGGTKRPGRGSGRGGRRVEPAVALRPLPQDLSGVQRPGVPTLELLAPSRRRSVDTRPPVRPPRLHRGGAFARLGGAIQPPLPDAAEVSRPHFQAGPHPARR